MLCQFTTFSAEVGFSNLENLNSVILSLSTYLFSVNAMSRHKRTMHRVMRNLHGLKLRRYVVLIINISEYLDVLPGAKASDKICEMEVNEVLFNSMVNF